VFNNTLGNNAYEPVPDCGMVGSSLTAADYACGDIPHLIHRAAATGGWANFEAAS
jgi:hypothetical protein